MNVGLDVVVAERFFQRLDHLTAVLGLLHVDEIDDDDAAEIAQAQLPRDGHRRLQIGAENRLFQVPVADEAHRC